jgi:hypothetical protein
MAYRTCRLFLYPIFPTFSPHLTIILQKVVKTYTQEVRIFRGREAHDLGLPLMRPMVMEFPSDTENLPDSVMIDGVKARKDKVWTIDRKAGVCCVALPDDGLRHVIRLLRNVF